MGVVVRTVHQAVLAAAVTTGVVAAVRHRSSTSKAVMPETAAPAPAALTPKPRATKTTAAPKSTEKKSSSAKSRTATTRTAKPRAAKPRSVKATAVAVPAQRHSGIDELGLRVDDLVVTEHDAQDARLFDALDWTARAS